MDEITASAEDLMRQAGSTAQLYLLTATQDIDALLGEGYAAKHPELVGTFMRVCAMDMHTSVMAAVQQDASRAGLQAREAYDRMEG